MTLSAAAFSWLIGIALALTVLAPILLLLLLLRDHRKGELW